MNLTLGCKEQVDEEWIYILRNGTRMTQKEWTSQVEQHIQNNNNQDVLEKLKQKVGYKRWFSMDTPEDFAFQMYAAKYCTNIKRQQVERKTIVQPKVKKVSNKEQFGQISLI